MAFPSNVVSQPPTTPRVLIAISIVLVTFFQYSLSRRIEFTNASPVVDHENFSWASAVKSNATRRDSIITRSETKRLENYSAVEYFACCGLGHRLMRLSNAVFIQRKLQYGLRVFFGFCEETEIYQHLFGKPRPEDFENVSSTGMTFSINNDSPLFGGLSRRGKKFECKCRPDKIDSDYQFYSQLRDRFMGRSKIAAFRREHDFDNHTVIGVHIRAGNGETGHFESRSSGIQDLWLRNITERILEIARDHSNPLLYIATDTPSVISKVQSWVGPELVVVDLPQDRPEEGTGVLFGQSRSVVQSGDQCLRGWEAAVMDMILLSYSDVLVAARPSSFTQSLPMSLVFGGDPKVERPFCEINFSGTAIKCYQTFMGWCCGGKSWFSLRHTRKNEFLLAPPPDWDNVTFEVQPRENDVEACKVTPAKRRHACLPFSW